MHILCKGPPSGTPAQSSAAVDNQAAVIRRRKQSIEVPCAKALVSQTPAKETNLGFTYEADEKGNLWVSS
jgi:hypothetical protein